VSSWQTPLLVGFCAGLLGVLSGVSAWAGGGFFNAVATGGFWAGFILTAAALGEAVAIALPWILAREQEERPKHEEA
jgi:hypothetical protein